MLTHGYPKLLKLFGSGEIKFGDPIGIGPVASLVLVVFSEVVCTTLIGLGFLTRLSSIPVMITMLVAAFISHGADPFARKEMALLYLLVFTTLLVFGSGRYSVDGYLFGKKFKS
ncbi:MAG: DoxX family protein [Opitutaceae bacterium]|nr:DoxX family protein [Opitutaceae bacterium]